MTLFPIRLWHCGHLFSMSTIVPALIMLNVHSTINHPDFPSLQYHQLPRDGIISRLADAFHNLRSKDRCSQYLQQEPLDIIRIHKRWKQVERFYGVESRFVAGYEVQCSL